MKFFYSFPPPHFLPKKKIFFIKFRTSINFHKCVETVNGVEAKRKNEKVVEIFISFKTLFPGFKIYKFFILYEIFERFCPEKAHKF